MEEQIEQKTFQDEYFFLHELFTQTTWGWNLPYIASQQQRRVSMVHSSITNPKFMKISLEFSSRNSNLSWTTWKRSRVDYTLKETETRLRSTFQTHECRCEYRQCVGHFWSHARSKGNDVLHRPCDTMMAFDLAA